MTEWCLSYTRMAGSIFKTKLLCSTIISVYKEENYEIVSSQVDQIINYY